MTSKYSANNAWELPEPDRDWNDHPIQDPTVVDKDLGSSLYRASDCSGRNTEDGLLSQDEPLLEEQDEEDPLVVMLFQDEQEEAEEEKSHMCSTKKKKILFAAAVLVLILLFLIPSILLIQDKKNAKKRLKAPGAIQMDSVSVDVSQALPLVGMHVSIPKSAFPKLTALKPEKIECSVVHADEWGKPVVATIEELPEEGSSDVRRFAIQATLDPPKEDPDNVAQMFASVIWEALTRQRTYVGRYECHLQVEAKIGHILNWHHTEIEYVTLDLEGVWDQRTRKIYGDTLLNGGAERANRHPLFDREEDDDDDETDDYTTWSVNGTVYYDGNANQPTSFNEGYGGSDGDSIAANQETTALTTPTTPPLLSVPTPFEGAATVSPTPLVSAEAPSDDPVDTTASINDYATIHDPVLPYYNNDIGQVVFVEPPPPPPQEPTFVIHEISANGIQLGIRLQLPQTILDAIPMIEVHLPPLVLQAQLNGSPQSVYVELEQLDLHYNNSMDHHYAHAEIACAERQGGTCAWYNPLIQLFQDAVDHHQSSNSVINFYLQAHGSFLQQMVGPRHSIVLYKYSMATPHHWYHSSNKKHNRRDVLEEEDAQVDCVRAQNALFGDILEFLWCMDLQLSQGILLDGYLNFYGYGGSWTGDAAWERVGDILRLQGRGKVDLELDSNDETSMDLSASALLDMEDLKLAVYANNTANWMPFRMVVEARVKYFDPIDAVMVRLDNGILEFDSEEYVRAMGAFYLHKYDKRITFWAENNGNWWSPFRINAEGSAEYLDPEDTVIFRLDFDYERYVDATGEFRLDNLKEEISMVLTDPRLQVAMEGAIGNNDNVWGIWRVIYEGENLMTGESGMSLIGSGVKVEVQSEGRLTTKLKAEAISNSDVLSVDISEAELTWDGETLGDAKVSAELDSNGLDVSGEAGIMFSGKNKFSTDYSMSVNSEGLKVSVEGEVLDKEYKMTLETDWNLETEWGADYVVQAEVKEALVKFDDEIWTQITGSFDIIDPFGDDDKVTVDLASQGEVFGREFSMNIDGEWDFDNNGIFFEYSGSSRLSVDSGLVWSQFGQFSLMDPGTSDKYSGQMALLTMSDDATVQFDANLDCEWDDIQETLTCHLPKLLFGVLDTTYTDSTGSMLLDLPASTMELGLEDNYTIDDNGYVLSMSGAYSNDMVTGKIEELKVVWDGERRMDAAGEMELNVADISIGYDFEDSISETLMALDRGSMNMEWDDWDETLEAMTIRAENMRMVMSGDPWIHGGMGMGLDIPQSKMWMALQNNTTKLPIDLGVTFSVEDDQVSMSLGAVSSPPPSPPTPLVTFSPTASPIESLSPTSVATETEAPMPVGNASATEAPSRVTVNATVLIFNTEGLTSDFLSNPENAAILAEAFEDFVLNLIANLTDQNDEIGVGRRRRLEVSLLSDSPIVYGVEDVDCPTEGSQSIPANATCQIVVGGYALAVTADEDPDVVYATYVEETDKAIEEGMFQESIVAADPEFPAIVLGAVERTVPQKDGTAPPQTTVIPVDVQETAAPSSGGSRLTIAWMPLLWVASYLCIIW